MKLFGKEGKHVAGYNVWLQDLISDLCSLGGRRALLQGSPVPPTSRRGLGGRAEYHTGPWTTRRTGLAEDDQTLIAAAFCTKVGYQGQKPASQALFLIHHLEVLCLNPLLTAQGSHFIVGEIISL